MNILLIHQFFLPKNAGGGSRFNEMTRIWTDDCQANVTVISGMVHYASGKKEEIYKGKYFFREQLSDKLNIIRCHVSEAYNVNFLGRLWGYFSFVFSSIYAGLFKARDKYDIILVTSPPLFVAITAYILAKIKRLPYVFEVRDLWPESAIDTGVLQNKAIIKFAYWFEGFIYRKATLINVLTPAFRDKLINDKGVPPEKIIFIPNAADFSLSENLLQTFDTAAFRKLHDLEGKFVITYVGAHGVANHLIQVIEAAERLVDTNVLFLLIGDGMQKPYLQEETHKRNLKNVRFVDSVSKADVFKYILASDMGSSILKKVDTFKTVYSNKTFDYMSCKKPILMAIDGVSRALVEDANCGVYVEPENIDDWETKIRFYLNNRTLIQEQGQSGYDYAQQYFDRDFLAKKYFTHLEKVAKKDPSVF
jgi:glycosyltransferase involved in cell wall biosynthesis